MILLFLLHVAIITEITQNLNWKLLKHYTKSNIKLADSLQNINTNYVAQIHKAMCYYPKYLCITLHGYVTKDWLRKDTVFIEMKYDVMCLY